MSLLLYIETRIFFYFFGHTQLLFIKFLLLCIARYNDLNGFKRNFLNGIVCFSLQNIAFLFCPLCPYFVSFVLFPMSFLYKFY